jgi:hypothetical protein
MHTITVLICLFSIILSILTVMMGLKTIALRGTFRLKSACRNVLVFVTTLVVVGGYFGHFWSRMGHDAPLALTIFLGFECLIAGTVLLGQHLDANTKAMSRIMILELEALVEGRKAETITGWYKANPFGQWQYGEWPIKAVEPKLWKLTAFECDQHFWQIEVNGRRFRLEFTPKEALTPLQYTRMLKENIDRLKMLPTTGVDVNSLESAIASMINPALSFIVHPA